MNAMQMMVQRGASGEIALGKNLSGQDLRMFAVPIIVCMRQIVDLAERFVLWRFNLATQERWRE
ncbi:MAG TPA: hypothetical protein VGM36_03390 [Rhizomicrobium sp.]